MRICRTRKKKTVQGLSYSGKTTYLHARTKRPKMTPANLPFRQTTTGLKGDAFLRGVVFGAVCADLSGFGNLTGLSICTNN
jgi:hypothetical protein